MPVLHTALQLAARTLAEDFADYYSAETDTAGPADPALQAATVSFLEGIVALDDVSEAFMVRAAPGVTADGEPLPQAAGVNRGGSLRWPQATVLVVASPSRVGAHLRRRTCS